MTTWTPTNNYFNDFIDFEYDGTTYLIGVGCYDATVYMVKLDSNGDSAGYAYSRAIMDYSLAPSSGVRTMDCFGAGYRYGTRIYFSSNTGSGIFEVDGPSLIATLSRAGPDACDFTTSQYAGICL